MPEHLAQQYRRLKTIAAEDLGGATVAGLISEMALHAREMLQRWVHQLVLDRIFGTGVYRGVFVVSAETKRDSTTGEVIEICVPKQLQMFQSRVAEISRIYYLDPPQVYLALATDFPALRFGLLAKPHTNCRTSCKPNAATVSSLIYGRPRNTSGSFGRGPVG